MLIQLRFIIVLEIKIIVEQDFSLMTSTKIVTYGLSSCYFFLVDGQYVDKLFAYLNHHSKWFEPGQKPSVRARFILFPLYIRIDIFTCASTLCLLKHSSLLH